MSKREPTDSYIHLTMEDGKILRAEKVYEYDDVPGEVINETLGYGCCGCCGPLPPINLSIKAELTPAELIEEVRKLGEVK
jgi:hypothetical protein